MCLCEPQGCGAGCSTAACHENVSKDALLLLLLLFYKMYHICTFVDVIKKFKKLEIHFPPTELCMGGLIFFPPPPNLLVRLSASKRYSILF